MITTDVLLGQLPGLERLDLERWIANQWVRSERIHDSYAFEDIDVARVRLIFEMRSDMDINEAAMPVVLLLLDQVYDLRRQLNRSGGETNRRENGSTRRGQRIDLSATRGPEASP